MKKKGYVFVLFLLLIIGVSGCGATKTASQSNEGKKTITFGDTTFNPENSEPDINPHNAYSGWAAMRYGVGETLFRYSENMEREPWLATGYQLIDDFTWQITLRNDVYFTSGRQMDGNAVKEVLETLVAEHERAASDLKIASITAEGQTVTIVTKEPVPTFLNYLSDPYGIIYDVQAGVKDGIIQATGPYQAVSLISGERLELVKNEQYWNGQPKLDEITVLTISDGDTLTMALQSGEIDMAYGMPYASYPLFENEKYQFTSVSTSRAFFAWMNYQSPLTKDASVRQAIALGIDKNGFVQTLLNGNGYPAIGAFPNTFSFGGEAVHAEAYNPEKAKELLAAAGWQDTDNDGIREKNGKPLQIRWLTYPSRQELPLLAEAAQASLKEIGIGVEINSTADHNSIVQDTSAWNVYASAMVTAPTGDPEYFFKTAALTDASFNVGHYSNEQLEKLAQQLSTTFDEQERATLAIQMQQLLLDDHAYVFASHLRMSMISKAQVKGLQAHPTDFYEVTVDLDIER